MSALLSSVTSILLAVATFFLTLFGAPGYPGLKKVDMDKFTMTWNDEFDGNEIDGTKWGPGWWPAEKTSVRKGGYWNESMASVSDGCLHIATKYYENGLDGGGAGWYSTQLTTQGFFEQQYGYYEVRCILPKGAGLWSAFWMMCKGVGAIDGSGEDGTEIDVFESAFYYDVKNRDTVQSALHYDGYGEEHRQKQIHQTHIYTNNPYEEFNTYGLEWNENEYIFYINGQKCGSTKFGGVSKVPEYLLLSVEVGGENGEAKDSWAGPSIDTNTEEPTDFVVDYVRVYQYK